MRANTHENLVMLLDCWLGRRAGLLVITPLEGGEPKAVPMVDGALCERVDWQELQSFLANHRMNLVPGQVEGKGDRRRMGAFLQVVSRRHGVDLIAPHDWARSADDAGGACRIEGLDGEVRLSLDALPQAAAPDERQQALLAEGRAAAARGDWAGADALLSAARDLRLDEPLTLAWLAWARLNNIARPEAEREGDARAYVCLAAQLAPMDPEVGAKVREVLAASGALGAAAVA